VATFCHLTKQPNELLPHHWYASTQADDEAVAAAWYASLPSLMLADRFVLNSYAAPHHSGPTAMDETNTPYRGIHYTKANKFHNICLWHTEKYFKQSK